VSAGSASNRLNHAGQLADDDPVEIDPRACIVDADEIAARIVVQKHGVGDLGVSALGRAERVGDTKPPQWPGRAGKKRFHRARISTGGPIGWLGVSTWTDAI
jgi:hypothetical protein